MYLAASSKGLTLGVQAGELLISLCSSPRSALPSPLTIRLSVSITEGSVDSLDKSSHFQTCSGALSAGDRTLSPDEKTGAGKLN